MYVMPISPLLVLCIPLLVKLNLFLTEGRISTGCWSASVIAMTGGPPERGKYMQWETIPPRPTKASSRGGSGGSGGGDFNAGDFDFDKMIKFQMIQHLQQQQQRRQHVQQQPQYMYHQQQPQYMHQQQQPQQPQPIPTPTRSTNEINAYKEVVRAINKVADLKSSYKDTIKSAFRVLSGTISTEIDLVCNTIFSIGKKTFPTDASSAASSSTGIRLDIAQILAKVVSDETCLKLICDDLEMLL